jgi:hypothetical protein
MGAIVPPFYYLVNLFVAVAGRFCANMLKAFENLALRFDPHRSTPVCSPLYQSIFPAFPLLVDLRRSS